jgi:peptidyl-prolyl cis-trans isomerase C
MACSAHDVLAQAQPQPVTVNGTLIGRDRIAREAQHHPAATPVASWRQAAQALIVRELLLQEARRRGIAAEPLADDEGRRETEDEALIRTLIETDVSVPAPDADSCRRYFEANRRRFRSADIFGAAHILIAGRRDDPKAFRAARLKSKAVLAELQSTPERFAALAEQHSACPSAAQGGNLGQITRGQTVPEFEKALMAMVPGEIFCSAPVASRYGFHIIRLDRRIEGRALDFAAVADQIADYLAERSRRTATAQYIARLVSRATIGGIEVAGAAVHRVN